MDKIALLKQTELFVLDMDGTYYLGDKILPGARGFLDAVTGSGRRYLFYTNNSSASASDYIKKLAGMDTAITPDEIMTSGDVMINFLRTARPGKGVFLLGTPPLKKSFEEAGIALSASGADIVVLGFDKTLTYDRLTLACDLIRNGAEFLATHPDINCPVEGGFIPDCGAMAATITLSTGKEPVVTGKPHRETVEAVEERAKRLFGRAVDRERITFVGDRLYTDIATGVKNGARGALVLTGETRESDIAGSEVKPDAVFESLKEMGEELSKDQK